MYGTFLPDYNAPGTYGHPSKQWLHQTIEPLMPRVEGLAESLRAPVPEGEIGEAKRRKILKR